MVTLIKKMAGYIFQYKGRQKKEGLPTVIIAPMSLKKYKKCCDTIFLKVMVALGPILLKK